MQFITKIAGAEVFAAEHVLMPREHGGGFMREIEKSVRKFEKEHGAKPCVVLTHEQCEKLAREQDETDAQAKREAAKEAARAQPEPAPEPEAPASAEPEPSFE